MGSTSTIEDAWGGQVTAWAGVASIAFSVHDVLINLDDEVELVWCGHNRWIKLAYLLVRHIPYLAQGAIATLIQHWVAWSRSQCYAWLIYQNVVIGSLVLTVDIIFVLRVYAMYNCNRLILAILIALLLAEIGSMSAILSLTVPRFQLSERCLVVSTPHLFPFYWILPLIFETTLFALTLIKFARNISTQAALGRKHSIIFVLVRDGTWAYALIFVVMLLNTVFYSVEKSQLAGVFFEWEIATLSFAGSHVLLNTRRFIVQPNGASFWTNTTTIRFETHEMSGTTDSSGRSDIERSARTDIVTLPGSPPL